MTATGGTTGGVPVSTGGVSGGTSGAGGGGGAGGAVAGSGTGGTAATGGSSTTGGATPGGGGAGGTAAGAGGAGGAAAGASAGGAAPAELKMPILRSGKYVLEFDTTLFEVDPQVGGRITTFSVDSKNVIATQAGTGDAVNWGSTTWPSPQGDWLDDGKAGDWPPLEWIDSQPYTAALDGNTIVLTSGAPPASGMQAKLSVVKRFSADLAARAINIQIQFKNTGTAAKTWAAWQITRVGPNGLSFFLPMGSPLSNQLATTNSGGATWYQQPDGLPNTAGTATGAKLIGSASAPWLAHAVNGTLFVQAFPLIQAAQAATGEGQIEIYAANTKAYVELEPQSAATSLAAGATLTWDLRWYLRALPASTAVAPGSTDLLNLVQALVK
jgi:hypothetical protein